MPTIPNDMVGWALIALITFALLVAWLFSSARVRRLAAERDVLREQLSTVRQDLATQTAKREGFEQQCVALESEIKVVRNSEIGAKQSLASANANSDSLQEALNRGNARIDDLSREGAEIRQARDDALLSVVDAKKDLEHAKSLHEETKKFLEDAGKNLTTQFQAVSAQVLEQRGKVLGEQHVERLGAVVQPLSKHIKELEDKLALAETSRAEDRGSVVNMIQNLASAQTMLLTEASKLTNALRGNVKTRGNWGETLLDQVLESSGLVEGQNYRKQISGRDDDDGTILRPDVIVYLPDNRSIVVDSKVSLAAHDRFVNAEDDSAAAKALAEHVQAIRARINELHEKNYSKAFGVGGLDFVLMFVPIEGALAAALQERPELQTEALNRKVALVSPMTLHIALRTIEYLWRMDKLSHSMDSIVDKGRLVYDEAVRLGEALLELGGKLDGSKKAYDELYSKLLDPSRGIIRRAQELHKLGVAGKSKKRMPAELASAVDDGDQLDLAMPFDVAASDPNLALESDEDAAS